MGYRDTRMRIERLGAFRVRNVLRKWQREQENKWMKRFFILAPLRPAWQGSSVQSRGTHLFCCARPEPHSAPVRLTAVLGRPTRAVGHSEEVQTRLVCSKRNRAWQSLAADGVFRANASRFLSRSRKPQHPVERPGGSASIVLGAGRRQFPHAGGRQDAVRFSAG